MSNIASVQEMLAPAKLPSKSTATRVKHFIGDYGLIIVFVLVFVFLSIASPTFLTVDNLTNIVRQSSIIGFIALGMTFVMITSGIDLSVGSTVGLVGVLSGTIALGAGGGIWVALLVGVAAGIGIGLLNSVLILWGRILPFLATLATMAAIRSAGLVFTNGQPVTGLSDSFDWLGQGMVGPVPVPIILFIVAAFATDHLLARTRFGRHVYAIGGSEESAKKVGIPVKRVLVYVYVLAGFMAAIAGIVLTARVDGADPLAGTGYELQAIAATVIGGTSLFGGTGKIRGTVLGVLLVGVVLNGLDLLNVSSYYQQAIQGVILVLAVLLNRWKSD